MEWIQELKASVLDLDSNQIPDWLSELASLQSSAASI